MSAARHGEMLPGQKRSPQHVLSIKTYLAVYGALLLLTYITVQVSLLDLGEPALYVAMTVAVIKATLVVLYFMHLKFDARFNSVVFLSSLLFLVIFFSLTMIDLKTRGEVQEIQDNFGLRDQRALEEHVRSRRSGGGGTKAPADGSAQPKSDNP